MNIAVILLSRDAERLSNFATAMRSTKGSPFDVWPVGLGSGAHASAARVGFVDEALEMLAIQTALAAACSARAPDFVALLSDSCDLDPREFSNRIARMQANPLIAFSAASRGAVVLSAAGIEQLRTLGHESTFESVLTQLAERLHARGWLAEFAPQAAPAEKFRIATQASRRVFAWPDWRDRDELTRMFERYGRGLVGRTDVCLCLRRDPARDPDSDRVLEGLAVAHERTLGSNAALEVVVVDDVLSSADWPDLEREVDVVLALESSRAGERAVLCAALGRKLVHDSAALERALASEETTPTPVPATSGLAAEIDALHPWFYPVRIGNIDVVPGVRSHIDAAYLTNRTRCREMLLVDEVARRVDMAGRSVLELACNCAYWSSRYVAFGATRVVGLEGREEFARQAELYWSTNQFLPQGSFECLRGNISDERDWNGVRARGPFDVVLCAGILYHVPNYREILRWAAAQTREVLVVDTRVSDQPETPIEEPGELYFNAIRQTRVKVVPNRERLVATLTELGFAVEAVPAPFRAQLGVENVDDYAAGNAVTLIARRVAIPRAQTRELAAPAAR